MRYNLHNIRHLLEMYSSVVLSIFIEYLFVFVTAKTFPSLPTPARWDIQSIDLIAWNKEREVTF